MNTNKQTGKILEAVQVKLSALWVAIMLTYLLGGVMKIFAGDFIVGEIDGTKITGIMLLGIAMLMVVPIVMIILSLTCYWSRYVNIIVSLFFLGLNILGLLGSPSAYELFLILIGLVFNLIILRIARRWSHS